MIRILLRPAFYRAIARDLYAAVKHAWKGPTCRVTGDRAHPTLRVIHERDEHPTDGPCVLL